jgi:serine/threonine protein phosphatase PrpC
MTRLAWGSATDVGRVRPANQDLFFTSDSLAAVADGMGGHQGGEVAAAVAIDSLRHEFAEPSTDALVRAVQLANDAVVATAADDPDLLGMGTTLCALALVDVDGADRLAIVNVGDSRVYLLKGDGIEQVTDDHSLVATLERQGRLTRAEAAVHPQRNILTRALGIDARVMVDSWEVLPVVGDRYVLCSDGLFNEVDESRMAATSRRLADPDELARELVRLANEGGGRDNITVVVVDVLDDDGNGLKDEQAGDDAERVMAAVSGEARAAALMRTAADLSPQSDPRLDPATVSARQARRDARSERRAARPPRPPHFTWRVAFFVVAVLAVLGIGAAAITYYGRHTYYVGFDTDAVVIYQGRPGGVLWIQPEIVEPTDLTRADVPAASLAEVEKGKIEPTIDDAHQYVAHLYDQRSAPSTTTSTVPVPVPGTSLAPTGN